MREIRVGDYVISNGQVGTKDWVKTHHAYALVACRVLRLNKANGNPFLQDGPNDKSGHEWSKNFVDLVVKKPTIVINM